jgi:hypothetical protein
MNEGDEAIESTVTRKKKRRSGFRYSSKKVLERSRVKRETTNVGGNLLQRHIRVRLVTLSTMTVQLDQVFHFALIVLRNLMEMEWS